MDVRELRPGECTDPVESLARAIHETEAIAASRILGAGQIALAGGEPMPDWKDAPELVQEVRREHARLLLERMSR